MENITNWEDMKLFDVNRKYGNGEYNHNPKVQKVTFNGAGMTWKEWEDLCYEMAAERKVKVTYLVSQKELAVLDI